MCMRNNHTHSQPKSQEIQENRQGVGRQQPKPRTVAGIRTPRGRSRGQFKQRSRDRAQHLLDTACWQQMIRAGLGSKTYQNHTNTIPTPYNTIPKHNNTIPTIPKQYPNNNKTIPTPYQQHTKTYQNIPNPSCDLVPYRASIQFATKHLVRNLCERVAETLAKWPVPEITKLLQQTEAKTAC